MSNRDPDPPIGVPVKFWNEYCDLKRENWKRFSHIMWLWVIIIIVLFIHSWYFFWSHIRWVW